MAQRNYRKAEMKRGVTPEKVTKLTDAFRASASRNKAQGYLLGITFLEEVVKSIKTGKGDIPYDGLMIEFGIDKTAAGSPKPYVLVATEFRVQDGKEPEYGKIYATIDGNSTNPIVVGSPPLGGSGSGNQ